MSFRSVFIAISISFALILGAFLLHRARPSVEVDQPTADFVKATGKCAECHTNQQYSVVHEYELSYTPRRGFRAWTVISLNRISRRKSTMDLS